MDFGPDKQSKGVKAIVDDFAQKYGGEKEECIRIHQGHNPEISVTDETTAKAGWQLFYCNIDPRTNFGIREAGFYDNEYTRENGTWKIRGTNHSVIFREDFDRKGLTLVK